MTNQPEKNPDENHSELTSLIPWYIKGTLAPKEHALVERHLAICESCRKEALSCEALANSLPKSTESWKPSESHFSSIMAEVDKLETAVTQPEKLFNPVARPKTDFFHHMASWLSQTPTPVRWTLAFETLAVAALALLFVLPVQLQRKTDGVFETLSNAETPAQSAGALIRLTLADDMTTKELSDLLTQAKAQIQQGPSVVGSYTATVPARDAAQALTTFRSYPKVRLAQPIESGTSD
jgi:hypothetical protein